MGGASTATPELHRLHVVLCIPGNTCLMLGSCAPHQHVETWTKPHTSAPLRGQLYAAWVSGQQRRQGAQPRILQPLPRQAAHARQLASLVARVEDWLGARASV